MLFHFATARKRKNQMGVIQAEMGLWGYPDMSRLPHGQEGFTLSVNDPTLQFEYSVEKELQPLCGEHGITRIELHRPFLFVHLDWQDPSADYEAAVEIMAGASGEYLEQCAMN